MRLCQAANSKSLSVGAVGHWSLHQLWGLDVRTVTPDRARNVVSEGAGNFRGAQSVGEKVVPLRGRSYKVRR